MTHKMAKLGSKYYLLHICKNTITIEYKSIYKINLRILWHFSFSQPCMRHRLGIRSPIAALKVKIKDKSWWAKDTAKIQRPEGTEHQCDNQYTNKKILLGCLTATETLVFGTDVRIRRPFLLTLPASRPNTSPNLRPFQGDLSQNIHLYRLW